MFGYQKEDGIGYFVKADVDLYRKKGSFHCSAKKKCVYAVHMEY